MTKNWKRPFSSENVCQILVKNGLISSEQGEEVIRKQDRVQWQLENPQGRRLDKQDGANRSISIVDVIAALKIGRADDPKRTLDEEVIYQTLAREWEIPYEKVDPLSLDFNLVTGTIPYSFAIKHLVMPIGIDGDSLKVATSDPFNLEVFEDIARVSHKRIKPVLSPKADVIKLINEFYGFKRSIAAAEDQFAGPNVDLGNLEQYVRLKSETELPHTDQHIVYAVNHLLSYAFDQRASDIHIEPKRDVSLVRMRIDGVLHTVHTLPKNVHSAIISRIKNLSRLDISEKRKPQDGRIKTDKGGVEAEIRISTVPVAFGEKVVARIMDPDILFQNLDEMGFTPGDLMLYQRFISMPHGIVLVCGPTGSGKSTTLYSTLRSLSTSEVNITTVEDPIEMIHPDFNQIGVQPILGITFANILRNILRQDPDIIMIGEMRDLETAENAIQAALTGHLVLSTLHTNDAPSAVTRLLDLGVPAFLLRATLVGVVAQRLVRKICPECKESFEMDGRQLRSLGLDLGTEKKIRLSRGKGCLKCRNTGYYGRTGIFEVLPFTNSVKALTVKEVDQEAVNAQAGKEGMVSLRDNAVKKLLKGETTYQEVLRLTWERLQTTSVAESSI